MADLDFGWRTWLDIRLGCWVADLTSMICAGMAYTGVAVFHLATDDGYRVGAVGFVCQRYLWHRMRLQFGGGNSGGSILVAAILGSGSWQRRFLAVVILVSAIWWR